MIPKTIHYCWFGRNPKPELAEKCIRSWKKYCPDYEIIEWNEDNFDISAAPLYVRQAYDAKKWGFVPDYIRLWLVYNYGGIYLDTDVEIIRPLDDLLELQAFAGFEDGKHVAFGLGFGAEKGNRILKLLMDSYDTLDFYNADGSLNLIPSPQLNTKVLIEAGLQCNNTMQNLEGMTIFPMEYFCPLEFDIGKLNKTKNTYTIHWFAASWWSEQQRKEHKVMQRKTRFFRFVTGIIGEKAYHKIKRLLKH